MKTITLRLPERPTRYQIAKALADRDDLEKPYVHPKIPDMEYPTARAWRPTGVWGFISQILP